MPKVWRNEKGQLFHDECLMEDSGLITAVDLNELSFGEECEECGGVILAGPEEDEEDPQTA